MVNVEKNLSCECAVLSFTREMGSNNPHPIKEVSIGLAPLSASVASFGQKSFNKMMEENLGPLVGKQPPPDRHQWHRRPTDNRSPNKMMCNASDSSPTRSLEPMPSKDD